MGSSCVASLNFEKQFLEFMTGLTCCLVDTLTDGTCCCLIAFLLQGNCYLLNNQICYISEPDLLECKMTDVIRPLNKPCLPRKNSFIPMYYDPPKIKYLLRKNTLLLISYI
jgi:hypothetical protein